MIKDNCCFNYVCTVSGCKRACKRHDNIRLRLKGKPGNRPASTRKHVATFVHSLRLQLLNRTMIAELERVMLCYMHGNCYILTSTLAKE